MALFSPKIRVTLTDNRTGELIGETNMKAGDLPESFAAETTLTLGDQDWSVVSADPTTREEYTKSKSLRLSLSPIETVDPSTLLYSLPTICDPLPDAEDDLAADGLLILEDLWRQVEFIARAHEREIDGELAAIESIHAHESAGIGFKNLHVRTAIGSPLSPPPAFEDVADLCRGFRRAELGYHPAGHRIVDGFAFVQDGALALYGIAAAGRVQILGIQSSGDGNVAADTVEGLRRFADAHDLLLVDWCRCVNAPPGSESFARVFDTL